MPVNFSGWEVVDDGAAFTGVLLNPSQRPQDQGAYTMYHGTSVASARLIIANGFKQSASGMLGKGVYVSRSMAKASSYPKRAGLGFGPGLGLGLGLGLALGLGPHSLHGSNADRVVLEVLVRVGRVKRIAEDNHPLMTTWNAHGYDTAWVPPNCNMKSVPSGLEEDCVYDPKRVKVVCIAKAPNPTIEKELQDLVARSSTSRGGGSAPDVCSLCKRMTQQGSQHIEQQCWKCGKKICILMSKHFCPSK